MTLGEMLQLADDGLQIEVATRTREAFGAARTRCWRTCGTSCCGERWKAWA